MKKLPFLMLLLILAACNEGPDVRGIPGPAEVEALTEEDVLSPEETSEELKKGGYETFLMEDEDTTYVMQKYFMVFLKKGPNRNQDSTAAAKLQEQHMGHLSRMAEEGYASLIGPVGGDGDLRGIVIFNTPTEQMADSLARLDPMVQAGRLEVEVHPWWVSKGGKLQ